VNSSSAEANTIVVLGTKIGCFVCLLGGAVARAKLWPCVWGSGCPNHLDTHKEGPFSETANTPKSGKHPGVHSACSRPWPGVSVIMTFPEKVQCDPFFASRKSIDLTRVPSIQPSKSMLPSLLLTPKSKHVRLPVKEPITAEGETRPQFNAEFATDVSAKHSPDCLFCRIDK